MKKLILIIFLILGITTFQGCQNSEQPHEDNAEINDAMLQGREAARILVSKEWKDSIQLQNFILEARAKQSRYVIENKPQAAKAFDEGFVTLIKSVRPDLANIIFPDSLLNISPKK